MIEYVQLTFPLVISPEQVIRYHDLLIIQTCCVLWQTTLSLRRLLNYKSKHLQIIAKETLLFYGVEAAIMRQVKLWDTACNLNAIIFKSINF